MKPGLPTMGISPDELQTARRRSAKSWMIVLALILLQGLFSLWHLADLQTVGSNDDADYYVVAENIAHGEANPDTVLWTYLGKPHSIARPAGSYWGPGWPYALGFMMRFVGDSPVAALRICAFLSVFLPATVFLLLERLKTPWWVAAFGAVLVCVQGKLFSSMVVPDVSLSYELITTGGFVLFLGALGDRPSLTRLLPSAFVLALPIWLRGEGFIPLLAAIVGLLAAPWPWRQRVRCVVGFASLAGICLIPYFLYNVHFFGRITPEPRSLTPVMTDIKQLFEFGDQPSFDSYCKLGFKGIVALHVDALGSFADFLWINIPYLLLLTGIFGPLLRWIAYHRTEQRESAQSDMTFVPHAYEASCSRRPVCGRPVDCRAAGIITLWSFVVLSAAVPLLVAPVAANPGRFLVNITPMLCVLAAWTIAPLLRYRWAVNLGLLFVAAFLLSNVQWPFHIHKPWATGWKEPFLAIPTCLSPGHHPVLNADDAVLSERPCRVSAQLHVKSIMAPWDDTVIDGSDGARKSVGFIHNSGGKKRAVSADACRQVIQQFRPRFILAEDGSILDEFIERMKDLPLRVVYRGKNQDGQGYTWYAVPDDKAPVPAPN
jgi:hypothetical protein